MSRKEIEDGLQIIRASLKACNFSKNVWWAFGTVLKFTRGESIEENDDFDFHILREDWETFGTLVVPKLVDGGFQKLYTWRDTNGYITEYSFSYRGFKFEFFELVPNDADLQFVCYDQSTIYHYRLPIECGFDKDADKSLYGILLPKNVDLYLPALYGPNWRIPDPTYHYARDCFARYADFPHTQNPQWK